MCAETRNESEGSSEEPMAPQEQRKKRIGDVLVDLGYATSEQIDDVLSQEAEGNMQLGIRMLQAGLIDDAKLARARVDAVEPPAAAAFRVVYIAGMLGQQLQQPQSGRIRQRLHHLSQFFYGFHI